MTKKNTLFILIVFMNITTLLSGLKHHESYQIVLGAIGVGLMAIGIIGQLVWNYRQKRKQVL